MENTEQIPNLPDGSVLYVSATVHPDHPMHATFRKYIDPAPDIDFGRILKTVGPSIRRYFVNHIFDGTSEPLPEDLSGYLGLVVGCSLHYTNPEREEIAPWQHNIMNLIRRAVFEYDLPFLGLCGGGQLGLTALGGKVGPNPKGAGLEPEKVGSLVLRTTTVELTPEGKTDPLFEGCPGQCEMVAIHSDHLMEYPEGFRVLGNSPDVPNQVLAYGEKVRLFAVHPEMSSEFVQRFADPMIAAGGLGPYRKSVLENAVANLRPTPDANRRILRNFLANFCAKQQKKETLAETARI
jgi:GMP synthase (glutamine-hydrolysing)